MLGKRLRQLRGNRTQEDIAKNLKLSRARYSHYENERSEPDVETLQSLADFYNVSTDYLLGRTNEPSLHQNTTIQSQYIAHDLKQMISENKTLYYGNDLLELDEEMKNFLDLQMQMILKYSRDKKRKLRNKIENISK